LHGSNALDQAEARIDLKRISMEATNFTVRCQATRELIGDALRFKNAATALALSQELTQPTNAFFSDKLLRLDVLRETKNEELKLATAQCQREAATNIMKVSDMTTWLMTRSSPAAALTWLHTLPAAIQTNQPAALMTAGCQVLVQDWNGLQNSLTKQNWAELEFARHAYMARALRGQKLDGAATADWELAFKYASNQKSTLISLFRMAAQWNWIDEGEEILWTIVNRYPEEPWAAKDLQMALFMGGRTRSLMQLFGVEAKREPADLEIKNNLAMTAMLLDAQELNPYSLAREAYEKAPQNPSYASTYAYSLYLQKKYAEALKVMQKLTPKELNDPSIAGYYGLILKATGDNTKAQSYLGWAAKAKLLPEEQKLFQQALNH
jgi:tetratricopeptide (TPR) repeat protein